MTLPVRSPMTLPVRSPMTLPVRSPMTLPVRSPMTLPVRSPMTLPVRSPMTLPVRSPMTLPVRSPMTLPVRSLFDTFSPMPGLYLQRGRGCAGRLHGMTLREREERWKGGRLPACKSIEPQLRESESESEARRADSLRPSSFKVQAEPAGGFSDDAYAFSGGTAASPFTDRPLSGLTRAADPDGLPDPASGL